MNWQASFDVIRQHVVRVETPTGAGTGFLAFYNHDRSWCGIATAAHVVRHEEQWQLPICIRAEAAPATEIFVEAGYRKIYLDAILTRRLSFSQRESFSFQITPCH